jgi:hypothetical protein
MQVANDSWQLVGNAAATLLTFQNVGVSRIAYVFAATQPAAGAIALDSDAHFLADSGMIPVVVSNLKTASLNMYARNLGPGNGLLAVSSVA